MKDLYVLLVIICLLDPQLLHIDAFYCKKTIDEESLANESACSTNVLLYDLKFISRMLISNFDGGFFIREHEKLFE